MPSYKNLADVFQGGATTSQHVDARDDEHFADTTFALKRTRSLGLLDDFIIPGESKVKDDFVTDATVNKINQSHNNSNNNLALLQQQSAPQQQEQQPLKHRLPKLDTVIPKQPQTRSSILYNSDSSADESDDDDDNKNYLPHRNSSKEEPHHQIERSSSHSPSNLAAGVVSPEFLPHDDNDVLYEPQRHVDYLSHDWKESDISKSWRYIVLKRKDVANSARLENASWRTWAQAKNHLDTVSPESVNWSKESDVTWLYGPLYKEDEKPKKRSSTHSKVQQKENEQPAEEEKEKGPKPILKKRTAAEMMLSQAEFMRLSIMQNHHKEWNPHSGSPILEAIHHSNSPPHFRPHNNNHSSGDMRTLSPVSLNSPLIKTTSNVVDQSTESVATSQLTNSTTSEAKKNRHIHFNDTVEQCIAVDIPSEQELFSENEKQEEDEEDSESSCSDSDDEGGFCLKVKSPSSAFLYQQGFPGFQQPPQQKAQKQGPVPESKENLYKVDTGAYQTIALLPSTHLNYNTTDDESSDEGQEKEYTSIPFYDNRVSHNVHTNRNYDFHYNYDYNSIYTNGSDSKSNIIIDDSKNDNLKVFDIPDNLDLGSIVQIEDVNETQQTSEPSQDQSFSSLNSNSSSSLSKSNSGYNIKEQLPLPPYQSNTSVTGKTFQLGSNDEDEEDELSNDDNAETRSSDNINQRLQRISSGENFNASVNAMGQYSKLSAKTKDLANQFLGNWKK